MSNACPTFRLFKRIEFWYRRGAWCRPNKWFFGIDRDCCEKCIIVEVGWFGITFLFNNCRMD